MQQRQRGTVKCFDSDNSSGLISDPLGGPDISFSGNKGQEVKVYCLDYPCNVGFYPYSRPRNPQVGDVLVYVLGSNEQGRMATVWAFADDWDALAATIPPARWRVRQLLVANGRLSRLTTIWEGSDPDELNQHFPLDRLPHYWATNVQELARWCERLSMGGWVDCEDPRPYRTAGGLLRITNNTDRSRIRWMRDQYYKASV